MTEDRISDDLREAFEERAAIIEFGSGRPVGRRDAEAIAADQMALTDDEIEFLQGAHVARP